MRRRRRGFGEYFTRSLAASGLLYGLVIAYVVPAHLVAEQPTRLDRVAPSGPSAQEGPVNHPAWRPALARRFPGCGDMARWRRAEVPATVVVIRGDAQVVRIPFGDAFDRATSRSKADDVWIIGACR